MMLAGSHIPPFRVVTLGARLISTSSKASTPQGRAHPFFPHTVLTFDQFSIPQRFSACFRVEFDGLRRTTWVNTARKNTIPNRAETKKKKKIKSIWSPQATWI